MRKSTRRRRRDEGGALAFALIAMTAALAIAASAMYVALGSRRIAARSVQAKNAFFCAELALERVRQVIRDNWALRNSALDGTAGTWYTMPPMNDALGTPPGVPCPGAGGYYYRVTLQDDVDELGAATPNPLVDVNNRVMVHAEVFAPFSNDLQARVSVLMGSNAPPIKGYP